MNQFVEQPREPLRPLVDTPGTPDACLDSPFHETGPVAFDAGRTHDRRYWPEAYLFQIRREGAGTWLIGPTTLEDGAEMRLGGLADARSDVPWIIHAASQNLPYMLDVGIQPPALFDTELAGRLLGAPSVGLATLLEAKLGIWLCKAYPADNWATRPSPTSWLICAALDVDYLIELADLLCTELMAGNHTAWAEEGFIRTLRVFSTPPAPRWEPWRHLSGIQDLKHPRQLAVTQVLWQGRDLVARRRDHPPFRVLADATIIGFASGIDSESPLPDTPEFSRIPGFNARGSGGYRASQVRAVESMGRLSPSDHLSRRPGPNGIPRPRSWGRNSPERWELWERVRADIDAPAKGLGIQPSLIASSAIPQVFVHN